MRRVHRLSLRVPLVAIPVLVAVAVLGYLAGHHHASARPAAGKPTRVATVANVVLEYPSSWHSLSTLSPLPGLPLAQQLLLTPTAHPQDAGLIGGVLPVGEASPLPASFLARLTTLPHTEVVTFPGGQAYRYSDLSLPGYEGEVRAYAIPSQDAAPTALVCYARSGFTAYLSQCDQIVAALTFVGQSQYALTPDASYAESLDGVIATLDKERTALRGEMARSSPTRTRSALASSLAARFADASAALSAVEAPTAARAAATALAAALLQGRDAYRELSIAADSLGLPGEEVAQALKNIQLAEADADKALQAFSLLGYRATQS